MDTFLYLVACGLMKFLQALPLSWVARLGRAGGAVAYALDARHRRVALRNLELCLGSEKSPPELRGLARENFRRLGENYCCAIKTAAMTWEQLSSVVEFVGGAKFVYPPTPSGSRSVVTAIGHFGNFEIYARVGPLVPHLQFGTTYRGLRQPGLNRLLLALRQRADCAFFERRTEATALKAWMQGGTRLLGLLADQHAGTGGVRVPFFGHECATTASPAVFALRYDCPLHTTICYRVGLGRWRVEVGDEIPTRVNGKARSVEAITTDVNRALETAVRRDPANWFWVHNRWKPAKGKTAPHLPVPPQASTPPTTPCPDFESVRSP
jgi:KDO2-lipid IV(A) lauroyltransferase